MHNFSLVSIFLIHKGLVINEIKLKDDKTKTYEMLSTFKNIHSWHLDEPEVNSKNDMLSRIMNEWFSAAEIVKIYLKI